MNLCLLFAKLFWGESAIILHADLTRFTTHTQLCCQHSQSSPGYNSESGCVSDTRRNGQIRFEYGFFPCGFQKYLDSKILCVIYSLHNELLCNEVLDITNDFLYPRNSKIHENQPPYNETLLQRTNFARPLALRYIEVPLPVIAESNQVNQNPGLFYLY